VFGDLEHAERSTTLGVHDPFGHPLTVELSQFLDEVVVVQDDRAVRSDGHRVGIAGDRCTRVGGRVRCGAHPFSLINDVSVDSLVWHRAHVPQNVTSASSTTNPCVGPGLRQGTASPAHSTSATTPHSRQTMWWW